MTSARKTAYRYLLYQAMLDIRIYCQSRGEASQDLVVWQQQYQRSRIAGAIADWLHNLAEAAAGDFEWFDEVAFWKKHDYCCKRFPGELERYRILFDEKGAGQT